MLRMVGLLVLARTAFSLSRAPKLILRSSSNSANFVRCARPTDIALIDACNREHLPENYEKEFFDNHLRRWPELALVAFSERQEFMGYALGRVEELLPKSNGMSIFRYDEPVEYTGHLASIATHTKYRGRGVAQDLMRRLHFNLAEYYDMDKVNLYCRVSNTAAMNLYRNRLHYEIARRVPGYYLDGEEAHMMMLSRLKAQRLSLSEEERRFMLQANALTSQGTGLTGSTSPPLLGNREGSNST